MADWIDLILIAGLAWAAMLSSKAALEVLRRFSSLGPRSVVAGWMTTYAAWLMNGDAAVDMNIDVYPQQAYIQAGPCDLADMLQQVLAPLEARLAALERNLYVSIGSLERRLDQRMLQQADPNPANRQAGAVTRPDIPEVRAAVLHVDEIREEHATASAHCKIPSGVWVLLAFGVRLMVAQIWQYLPFATADLQTLVSSALMSRMSNTIHTTSKRHA